MATITVSTGDCVAHLAARVGPQFDSCVCDPPYELGFMGKKWDSSGVAFCVETWLAVFEQMKPGAHLIAFGGTRTYHRMVCAIEDAGFEIRDQLAWLYGSGFPKSHNVSKGIDRAAGASRKIIGERRTCKGDSGNQTYAALGEFHQSRTIPITAPATTDAAEWDGWGSALKPALEPIVLARKPLSENTIAANVLRWSVGALNIDGCRIDAPEGAVPSMKFFETGSERGFGGGLKGGARGEPQTDGRFPANVIHDGSEEVLDSFPESNSGGGPAVGTARTKANVYGDPTISLAEPYGQSNGSAARYFYSAKAGPLDRMGSEHPTIKPVDLMRWLCRLVTPPGGLILDPFAGSGTTGIAAMAEGFNAELIDLEPKHVADIERKLALLRGEGRSRFAEQDERKAARPNIAPMPLFGDAP